MSTSPRRKAERTTRKTQRNAPPAAANDPTPALAIGAEMLLINQAIITHRIRNDTHANFDQYETRVRASVELQAELLAEPERWCRELVRVWHDIALESIRAGNVSLGLTQHSIGTTVTHDRLYLLVRDLSAERAARSDDAPPAEVASGPADDPVE